MIRESNLVEINGVILIDGQIGNNWTPVKFGNTNKIDSPDLTGGTPILNTNEALVIVTSWI